MARKSAAELKRGKYADLMRAQGTPLMVLPEEFEQAQKVVTRLYNKGMAFSQIGESCKEFMHETTVAKIYNGTIGTIHRDTYTNILTARYVPVTGHRCGRRMDPTGVRRRMQALVADGFGYNVIGDVMGIRLQAVYQLCTRESLAFASTLSYVVPVYEKLAGQDPYAYGATKLGVSRAKGVARRKGWAPSHCWDEDTIDDPQAAPEWTGQCGTVYGFRIHYRDGILPVCGPCSKARTVARKWPALAGLMEVAAAPGVPGSTMSADTLASVQGALREGVGLHAIAADFGCSTRTVERIKREMRNGGEEIPS
jgi:hypothetical protein